MKTVAILAPMADPAASAKRLNMDFALKLKKTGEELTFETIHHLANHSYNPNTIIQRSSIELDEISAAGYYLTGLLRQNHYNTVTTSDIDDVSLRNIAKQNPIAFCISTTMILQKDSLAVIISQIRKIMKDVLIIVGGVLVWKSYLFTQEFQNQTGFNVSEKTGLIFPCNQSQVAADIFVVSDHGGNILLNILDEINQKGIHADLNHIPNLALPDVKGNFYFTNIIKEKIQYDEDYTHWELVDELPMRIPIRTSVGCPYRCGYCDFCFLYPKIKFRSMASIQQELNILKNLMARSSGNIKRIINFTDDNVFITPKRVDEICRTLIKVDMGLSWSGFIRASSINPSNIGLISESGLKRAWIGVESGDQDQLNRMNKKQNVAHVKRGIELLDSRKISVLMTFLVGYLGENESTINNTIDFLNHLTVTNSNYTVFPLLIFPMSEISLPQIRAEWKVKGIFKEWSHKTMDSKTALEKSKFVFEKVTNVPYCYVQESNTFLQKYDAKIRKILYAKRHEITLALMNQAPWENIARLFSEISLSLGVDSMPPPPEFQQEIEFPSD
jgi:radical SAM superfamily enzyme YgiQ (UPF0313 family)